MDLTKEIIKVLSEELDEVNLIKANDFIEQELTKSQFIKELKRYEDLMIKDGDKELNIQNKERNVYIVKLMLLGMGRNRIEKTLKEYKVTRTTFEKVRDGVGAKGSLIKQNNEKIITALKFDTKARARRLKAIKDNGNWNAIKEEYVKGESPKNLEKKYNLSGHYITLQLEEEGLFDEMRSTLTRKKIAENKEAKIDDNFIIRLVKDNPLDSKDLLWEKAKEQYPWLLRRQMYKKLEDLGLERSDEEVNVLRGIKSMTESNTSYMVKVNGYKAAKEVFGSIDNLVDLYMTGNLGSFNKVANKINKEVSFDYEISERQVSKIITSHPDYKREGSLGQNQLYKFVKNSFKDYKVKEEFAWDEKSPNRQIDIYIPELNIAFEFNGDYWHSDTVINYNYGKSAHDFHKQRAEEVKELLGAKLMYVWEDDWNRNYEEVERAIINKEWDSIILNKYSNTVKRSNSYSSPNKAPSLLRNQILRFLKEKKINYEKENNSHLIKIYSHNLIINVPNYNSLSNEKETLNLQKYYEDKGVELLTFLPWRNIFKIKEFLTYRLNLSSVKRIPARKCKIVSNDKITKEQRRFFADNHLLGYNNFKNIEKTITLEHEGEVVIAALFTRKPGSQKTELKRLVSSYGVSVQGGASRLIKEYSRQNETATHLYTFSDCDLGFGGVYQTLGFDMIERSGEQLNWYNEELEMVFSNLSLVMVGSDRLLKGLENYQEVGVGENLPTNQEIVQEYGFIPIYDSGYKKWELSIK